jgi:hypothetical protein
MIKAKNKECIICGRTDQPWFSKKRCKSCTVSSTPNTLTQRKTIKKQTQKNIAYRNTRSEIRDAYFDHHLKECVASEFSGKHIYLPTRANICHLFDKGRHPSVQGNIANYIYLTLDEHTRFDQLLYSHEFEKLQEEFGHAWILALGRMEMLLDEVQEQTKFKLKIEEWIASKK